MVFTMIGGLNMKVAPEVLKLKLKIVHLSK